MLEQLVAAVDGLCAVEPAALADGEAVVALHRLCERLSAVTTRAVACFEAGREWDADGARSAASWLARRCRQPLSAARRRVRLGRGGVDLGESGEGMWFADGVRDAVSGEVISRALGRIEDELFEAEWAEAKARVGEAVCAGDLRRTPAQRRADAWVEMARRA